MSEDSERPDIFISHSSAEGDLADYMKTWLNRVVPHKRVFCSSRPRDLPPGDKWRTVICQKATKAGILLLMLSPDSVERAWLQFEAGLFLGSGVPDQKLVPVLYGGVLPTMIPTTVSPNQALLLDSPTSFEAFVSARLLGGAPLTADATYAAFLAKASIRVLRLLRFGEFGLLAPDASYTESLSPCVLKDPKDAFHFDAQVPAGRLIAVRATVVPRRIGPMIHWKCGFHIGGSPTSAADTVFRFHSGCHEGLRSWSVYPEAKDRLPFNIPWKLDVELPHTLQLWLTTDGRFVSCVGIDSGGNRVILNSDVGRPSWRLLNTQWSQVRFSAWADGRPFQVDVEQLEIDREAEGAT